jgi:hypothetical protein
MTTMKHLLGVTTLLLLLVFFTQCKEDDSAQPKGTARIEITDGPIDDANVKGAFVTVTAVKVDGKEISGFSKQTIDLMAYQNGETKLLGTADLEAGTYSDLSLVLDYEKDASGNSPGCYVLTSDNVKHSLKATSSTTSEVKANTGSFKIDEGGATNVVLDFDLRKSIRYEDAPQSTDQYDFVTDSELRSSLRFVAKAEAGKVTGNFGLAGDKIVVYAYKKGTFNKGTEVSGQGESNVQFKGAVTSAVANNQGNFTLAFLEAGNYELHFFGYEDTNNDGKMEMKGELELSLLGNLGIDLNNVSVGANATANVSVKVLGLLP